MAITDIRMTVIQIINEVQRKLGLSEQSSLSANPQTRTLLDYLNDVVDVVSDYDNWQEAVTTANVTCVSGQVDYSISTNAVVKNITNIVFGSSSAYMYLTDIDQLRRLLRSNAQGEPRQYAIYGTDSNGNPQFRVYPKPAATQDSKVFSILYYTKPPLYTTSDTATVVPFPSRVVVQGLLARAILDEEGGAQTEHYIREQEKFEKMLREAYNRFNADSSNTASMIPSTRYRRR